MEKNKKRDPETEENLFYFPKSIFEIMAPDHHRFKPSDVKKNKHVPKKVRKKHLTHQGRNAFYVVMRQPHLDRIADAQHQDEFVKLAMAEFDKFVDLRDKLAFTGLPINKSNVQKLVERKYYEVEKWASQVNNSRLIPGLMLCAARLTPALVFHSFSVDLKVEERIRWEIIAECLGKLEALTIFTPEKFTYKWLWMNIKERAEDNGELIGNKSHNLAFQPFVTWLVDYCDEENYSESTKLFVELLHIYKTKYLIWKKLDSEAIKVSLNTYLSESRKTFKEYNIR